MISEKPIVSIFGSSARPFLWDKLIKSLEKETLSFEIIYTGPAPINLDPRVRYIKSFFKPTQCMQISALFAKGDFLLHIVDDLIFCENKPLTNLLDEYKQNYQNKEVILSTKLKRNGIKYDDNNYFLYKNDQNSFIPISLFIKKSFFLELGGFDKSFITCMADADLIYRAVSSNKAAFYFSNVFVEEDKSVTKITLFDIYGYRDLNKLIKFWFNNEIFIIEKRPTLKPYNKILLKRNSPNGIWLVNSQFLINIYKYFLYKYYRIKNILIKYV
jgi:hypothetical protein